ncbi:MAG: DUF167 domain-containing protein [Planctomycetaceae bacterium]|nr:DUF167 domain-containing protein [Planctomycetaceae bacterium]
MSLDLTKTDNGILLPVHAQPGAKREGIVGVHDGRLKVAVTTAPEQGKANQQLEKVLAKALGLRRAQVTLFKGPTNARKVFCISGVELSVLRERIDEILVGF